MRLPPLRFAQASGLALLLAGCAAPSAQHVSRGAADPTRSAPPAATRAAEPVAPTAPASTASEASYGAEAEAIDDGAEGLEASPESGATLAPHPLDGKPESELEKLLLEDRQALGSASIGSPNAGRLFGGVQMPSGERWSVVDGAHAWGTKETVESLVRCIDKVHELFPETPALYIGHISAERGGHLQPHVSHQAGRDVDVGYYYQSGARWYGRAHEGNLDRARTWAFVRALITESDVELILIDHSIQKLLEDHARKMGEYPAWLDSVFRGTPGKLPPLIRHAKGHRTHLHVRFYSPVARQTARLMLPVMVRHQLVEPPASFVHHRVKNGETLGMLARKYKTSVRAIKNANRLRSNLIRARKVYLIPQAAKLKLSVPPVVVPARRLPPGSSPDSNGRVRSTVK